jgi:hypothetical protein
MVPADQREVDSEEGAFMMSQPPNPFKASEFGHLPQHWYSHVMHALEIIAHRHPLDTVKDDCVYLYTKMVSNLHLNPETYGEMVERLSEDRIEKGTVVS